MEQEENFNWLETYMDIQEGKDIKNSEAFKILNSNNIDTNELTKHEKDKDAGLVKLNYKDEKEKETDGYNYAKGLLNFVADMPEETGKALMTAFLNGTDVAANVVGVVFNAMTNVDPAMNAAFNNGDGKNFKTLLNKNIQDFSNYLNSEKEQVAKIGEGSPTSSKAAEFVSMITQDTPYSLPIYKKFKKLGMPDWMALPVAYGIGSAVAFDDDASIFLNSEQVQGFKNMIGVLPDSSEEEIYNKTFRMLEGTGLGFATSPIIKGLKYAKNNIPAFMKPQSTISVGGAAIAGEGAIKAQENAEENLNVENQNLDEEKKTLNFDDQSSNKTMMEMFYGLDKTQQERISAATGYPKDQIQQAGLVPIFKSILKETAKKLANKGTGEQMFNQLKNTPGVKQSELKWTGLDEFLKGKKSVTKQEVQDYLKATSLDVSEVKFGGKASKLPDEIEFKVNEFESKVEKAARKAGEGYADINYDVYNFKSKTYASGKAVNKLGEPTQSQVRALASKTGIDEQVHKVDFGSIIRFPFFKLIKSVDDFPRYLNAKGKIEITNVEKIGMSGVSRLPKNIVTVSAKEADDLLKANSKNKLISTFEIEPLELEKALVENAKREFRLLDTKAPKFETFTEPGGEDYIELVFKIKKGGMDVGIPTENIKEGVKKISNTPYKNPSHMDVKSEIAHVRFKTREIPGPRAGVKEGSLKVLTVEEMQSDFAIMARKANEFSAKFDDQRVTDFPFKNTWYEMTIKRLIRYAADNGFDAVAIPKGSVAASRYGQEIDKLKNVLISKEPFNPNEWKGWNNKGKSMNNYNEQFVLEYRDEKGLVRKTETYLDLEDVHKIIGQKNIKDLDKLKLNAQGGAAFFPLDKPIIIGSGKGKAELYDKAIPGFMKKYGKKWNAKVYDDHFPTLTEKDYSSAIAAGQEVNIPKGIPVTIIKLTPEMKKAVQTDGQALFNIFGIGAGAAIGSNAILDNQGNNTISNLTEN